MGLKRSLDRIEYLDYLIKRKCTGTPKELAKKLGISERWLYELLNELRYDLGCPIRYSKTKRSYVYTRKGSLVIEFISEEEQRAVNAGNKIYSEFFPSLLYKCSMYVQI